MLRKHIKFFHILYRYRYRFLITILFIIGIWIRLYKLDSNLWSDPVHDESRDILVANHIISYGETITKGPWAEGAHNLLMNSPIYYYLIASIWFFTRSPIYFMRVWAILMSCLIPLAYYIGKKIWDKKTGFIFALLIMLNPYLIFNSLELSQPHMLPIFSLFLLFAIVRYIKKSGILNLCLILFFLLFPLNVHYSILILLPFGLSWSFYEWLKLIKKKKTWKSVLIPILFGGGLFISWVMLTYMSRPFDQLLFFNHNLSSGNISYSSQVYQSLIMLFRSTWFNLEFRQSAVLTVCLIAIASFSIRLARDKILMKQEYFIFLMFILSVFVTGFYKGEITIYYLYSLIPFLLILFAISLRVLLEYNKTIGLIGIIVFLYLFGSPAWSFISSKNSSYSYFFESQNVARVIYNDYLKISSKDKSRKKLPSFILAELFTTKILPFDKWATSAFWYHLENITNHQLVEIKNYSVNFEPLVRKPEYFYLICDNRTKKELIQSECLNRFEKVRDYLSLQMVIYESNNYTVWRFLISPLILPNDYNYVYTDLIHTSDKTE